MWISDNFGPKGPESPRSRAIKLRNDIREKLKEASSLEAEMMRFYIEALDWVINEGGEPRSWEEMQSEHKRLAREKQIAEGIERLRMESRSVALRDIGGFWESPDKDQRMTESRLLMEKIESKMNVIGNADRVEQGTTLSEVVIEGKNGRKIKTILVVPRDQGSSPFPGMIVVHDTWGVTGHIRSVARRFAAAGYVTAVPFLNASEDTRSYEAGIEDLTSVLDYLRKRSEVEKYSVGCIGFGFGGTLSVNFALNAANLKSCMAFYAEYPPIEQALNSRLRASMQFVQAGQDHPTVDHFQLRQEEYRKEFGRPGRHWQLIGSGGVHESAKRDFFNEESPNYDKELSRIMWDSILLHFEQELFADRSSILDDQVGIQFSKLTAKERGTFLDRMKHDREFAKQVASGFGAFWDGQTDEDRQIFLALMQTDDVIAEGIGGPSASNFASRSKEEKKLFLKLAREHESFAKGFLEHSSFPIEKHMETKLLSEDRKAIFGTCDFFFEKHAVFWPE